MIEDNSYTVKMLVTPQIAEQWLKKNVVNRKISKERINQYAMDMKSKNWQFYQPDSITFGVDGSLKNGQHRLNAVISSGETVGFNVTFDSNCTMFDRGRSRSIKDNMVIDGNSNAMGTLIAVARFHFNVMGLRCVPDSEIVKFIQRNETGMEKALSMAWIGSSGTSGRSALMRAAPCQYALLILLNAGISEEVLKDFSTVVNSGYGNSNLDFSAITLRNQLIDVRQRGFSSRKYMLGITLEAGKVYSEKKERKRKFKGEKFPYLDNFVTDDTIQKYKDEDLEETNES